MTEPNFEAMSRSQLKTYLVEHRDDNRAWDVFFAMIDQDRSVENEWFAAPLDDESIALSEQAIQQKVKEIESLKSQ